MIFNPKKHLYQQGDKVTLIPFTRSPMNILEEIKKIPRRTVEDDGVSLSTFLALFDQPLVPSLILGSVNRSCQLQADPVRVLPNLCSDL